MIKTALLILLFSFCASYGVIKNITLRCRIVNLTAARDSLLLLKNEIERSVSDIYSASAEIAEKDKLGIFHYLKNRSFSPSENYAYAREKSGSKLCLSRYDWETLDGFFASLGSSDGKTQTENCEKTLSALEKAISEAEENSRKYSKLYASAGVLVGLFLVIILV